MSIDFATARAVVFGVLRPEYFVSSLPLTWTHTEAETSRWEVFQGRLLDPAHTRQEATFETLNFHEERAGVASPEAILSLKLDATRGVLHVVRGVECYVHEAYSEGNVIQTREARRWVRELVASFELARFDDAAALRQEVGLALLRALIGTRLPLTPVEAPLPSFTFGQLFYFPEANPFGQSARSIAEALGVWWEPAVRLGLQGRLLEFALRAGCDLRALAMFLGDVLLIPESPRPSCPALAPLLLRVFEDISLSPWTELVPNVVRLLAVGETLRVFGPGDCIDFESALLLLVCRHLTAYDLVLFHHRGANYPDALLLDCVLNDYLARLDRTPELFAGEAGRLRRRALRQAYLLRRRYENHPVPDLPTSPGEHTRVLPNDFARVPEEQILNPAARRRRLFENDPLLPRLSPVALDVLRQSITDLDHVDERQELGAAVYLDRPFGDAKAPVEPDATPLVASLAYSRSIAIQRLRTLWGDLNMPESDESGYELPGISLERIGPPTRLGTVSLSDAVRAAPDFVYRFTLPGSVRALREWIDFGALGERITGRVLIARAVGELGLSVYDETLRRIGRLVPQSGQGYVSRRGIEYPTGAIEVGE